MIDTTELNSPATDPSAAASPTKGPCAADAPKVGRASLTVLNERELTALERPAQYLGGEKNSVVKDDAEVDVHLCLAFPDTYEVGMSHVGMQILYELVNSDPKAWAERSYMPLPDMEQLLRSKGALLSSLESQRAIRDFDIVGISLQYELCGTNILAMLELGGIPFRAAERGDDYPLVIGGGPYSYHPEALAPFFDVFFLGDAEEFIPELLQAVRTAKASGKRSKAEMLRTLRSVEGIYIPADFEANYAADGSFTGVTPLNPERTTVVRRLLPTMEGAPYAKRPIVPNVQTVHNRLSLEVMRGCVRGCRFCQAGYLYRPQRERTPQEIMEMIEQAIGETGFEELSLLSLSTADYCSIVPLLKGLVERYGDGDRLAISFPSTRVDALTPEVLEQVQTVRRTGFTVAPEGGTQRLRDVINKGVSDEQILETATNVFTLGWHSIKLYFMLGLPTETDEDLQGIIDIARRIKALPVARGKDITVSVSTHVPKPHTPFQWAEQISPQETIRKQRLLADGLRRAGVNFRYHDHFSSFLEGIFCRSGREMARVVERAYELGARLDAWQEHLSEEVWMQAFADCNINPSYYLRERPVELPLEWDHLSCGIPKSYFAKEWRRALRDRPTPDCLTQSCSICGACDYDAKKNVLWPRHETQEWYDAQLSAELRQAGAESVQAKTVGGIPPKQRIRVKYAKSGAYRFLGHLELVTVVHRAARRAALPIHYTQGFHPMPKFAFGPPLQLGVASSEEYFDAYFSQEIDAADVLERLNREFPPGLSVASTEVIALNAKSLNDSFTSMRYRATWHSDPQGVFAATDKDVAKQIAETQIVRASSKKSKGRPGKAEKRFVVGQFVSDAWVSDTGIEFTLAFNPQRAGPKPIEVVNAISGLSVGDYSLEKVECEF